MRNVTRSMLLAAAACCLRAQTPAQFDVASFKPGGPMAPGAQLNINLGSIQHGTLTLTNTSLADCLRFAYTISTDEQIAGPDWIKNKSVRFDVLAKAPAETPDSQIRLMLQSLLIERFHLELHHEARIISYLALAPGKNGAKLTESKESGAPSRNVNTIGRIASTRVSMITLVTVLSRFLREPVVDRTGLPGYYEVNLQWAPDSPQLAGIPNPPPNSDLPSIFGAVEAQLGLRLESHKGPLDVLVVDHADRDPIGN